jgi:hypothetical protein
MPTTATQSKTTTRKQTRRRKPPEATQEAQDAKKATRGRTPKAVTAAPKGVSEPPIYLTIVGRALSHRVPRSR